jgi:hypothetical protein
MSFTNKQEILLDFILDFADQIDLEKVKPGFLTSLVNLSHDVSIVDTWKNKSIEKDIMEKCIYQSCLILNARPEVDGKTQVFQWLAIWLDIKALQKSMSAEELFQNAWNSLKKDGKS